MNKKIKSLVLILWLVVLFFTPFKDTVRAASGWTLRGRVTDSSGKGLSGFRVEACNANYYYAFPDSNGNYVITGAVPGTYILQAYPKKGYANSVYWDYVLAAGDDKTVNFTVLPGGGSIQGHILNGSGAGVASATVEVFEKFGGSGSSNGSYVKTTADANGYFDTGVTNSTYGGLPTGTAEVKATSGGKSGWNHNVVVTAGQATSNANVYILTGTSSVSGHVKDLPSNAAINGATVIADNGAGVMVGVSTDASGYFTISGLPASSYHLVAHLGNMQTGKSYSHYWNITLSDGQHKDIDFGLKNGGGWISGRVMDGSGNGVAAAKVQLWENTGVGPGGTDNGSYTETTADGNGNFTTDPVVNGGLPTGSMRVRASNSAKMSAWNYAVPVTSGGATSNVDIIIYSGNGSITGSITNSNNGMAVAGAEVVVDNGLGQSAAVSDNYGNYSVGGLPGSNFNVVVEKAGYASAHCYEIKVIDGQPTNHVDFNLSSQVGWITGHVKDGKGNPVQNVSILADSNDGTGFGATSTDATGSYTLSNLEPMNYFVHAAKPGYAGISQTAVVQSGTMPTTTDFVLGSASRQISGRVTKDGLAAPYASVYVNTSVRSNVLIYSNTFADKNGYYTVQDLAPGKYDVHFSSVPGYSNEVLFSIDATTTNATNVNINFTKGTSTIAGHVTDTTGKPLAGVNVQSFQESSPGTYASVYTDASGYYSISGMASGLYFFGIYKVGFDLIEKYWFQINPNTTMEVNFVMGLAKTIVTSPANVMVTTQEHAGTYIGMVVELSAGTASGWTAYSSVPWLLLGPGGNTYQVSGQVGDVLIVRFDPDKAPQSVNTTNIKIVAPGLPDGSLPVTMTILGKYKTFMPMLVK